MARYYNPSIGRFVGEDPLRRAAPPTVEENPYWYVMNEPVKYYDPSGMKVFKCCESSNVSFGLAEKVNRPHCWLKTDTIEFGMQEYAQTSFQTLKCLPSKPTAIVYETGRSKKNDSSCEEIKDADEGCVNREFEYGKSLGCWAPYTNDCVVFESLVLANCGHRCKGCIPYYEPPPNLLGPRY